MPKTNVPIYFREEGFWINAITKELCYLQKVICKVKVEDGKIISEQELQAEIEKAFKNDDLINNWLEQRVNEKSSQSCEVCKKKIKDIFINMIHIEHTEVSCKDGNLTSLAILDDTKCYVCDILQETRKRIYKDLFEPKQDKQEGEK